MSIAEKVHEELGDLVPVHELVNLIIDYCGMHPVKLPELLHLIHWSELSEIAQKRETKKIDVLHDEIMPLIVVGQLGCLKRSNGHRLTDTSINFIVTAVQLVDLQYELDVIFVHDHNKNGQRYMIDASIVTPPLIKSKPELTLETQRRLKIECPCMTFSQFFILYIFVDLFIGTCHSLSNEYDVHVSDCSFRLVCVHEFQRKINEENKNKIVISLKDPPPANLFNKFRVLISAESNASAVYDWEYQQIAIRPTNIQPSLGRFKFMFKVQSKSNPRSARISRYDLPSNNCLANLFHLPTTRCQWFP